ncbi:MAG: hypothetical protein R3218_03965, partial [Christiangramia sp.]|nr:hypothetical protein [Christiangramia sp.]
MMRIKIFLTIAIIGLLLGCSSSSKKDSKIRIGQFLFSEDPVEISFIKKAENKNRKTLKYGELTNYEDLAPGTYTIEVRSSEDLLLKKEIGIGIDGRYTLIINGIQKENQETNQKTTKMRLHEIVEGEEAIYANGNLPQLRILNDEFEVGKNEAKIRWIHLAPGVEAITAETKPKGNKTKSLSKLTYPKISKNFSIKLKSQ